MVLLQLKLMKSRTFLSEFVQAYPVNWRKICCDLKRLTYSLKTLTLSCIGLLYGCTEPLNCLFRMHWATPGYKERLATWTWLWSVAIWRRRRPARIGRSSSTQCVHSQTAPTLLPRLNKDHNTSQLTQSNLNFDSSNFWRCSERILCSMSVVWKLSME